MNKILLVSEVASLGRDLEKHAERNSNDQSTPPSQSMFGGMDANRLASLLGKAQDESSAGLWTSAKSEMGESERIIDPEDRHPLTGSLSSSQKLKIVQLLGAWEEPLVTERKTVSF